MVVKWINSLRQDAWYIFSVRLSIFLSLWYMFCDKSIHSILAGLSASIVSTFLSVLLLPQPLELWFLYLPRFLIFFLKHSVIGSIDVARRACRKNIQIIPTVIEYSSNLSKDSALFVFVTVIGLLPGTICIRRADKQLLIHAIDGNADVAGELRQLENHIALLFGEEKNNG